MPLAADIGLAYHRRGTHCGVYFTNEHNAIAFVHFGTGITTEDPSNVRFYMPVQTKILEDERVALSNFVRHVLRNPRSRSVHYAIYSTAGFSEIGDPIVPSGSGFTCATFVHQIFSDGLDHPLIVVETLPEANSANTTWAREFLAFLKSKFPMIPAHWAAASVETIWRRVLPEHVAAAAAFTPHPAEFPQIKKSASSLVSSLKNMHPQMQWRD